MLHAYIDESGDEGVKDTSSAWLSLGCVLLNEKDADGSKTFLRDGIGAVWKGRQAPSHVHFRKIQSHPQRKALLRMLTGLDFRLAVVTAKKSEFAESVMKNLKCPHFYNYLAKHLLERISWFGYDRSVKVNITFAERNEASWDQFEAYIELLKNRFDHQIKWPYIGAIRNSPANINVLLQAADWCASGFAGGLNPDPFGDVEASYTGILWPKFWRRNAKLWSYGIKILPSNFDRSKESLFRKIDTWLEDPTAI